MTIDDEESERKWSETILSKLKEFKKASGSSDGLIQVKKLRKQILNSFDLEDGDKHGKKQFKRTMKSMEEEGLVSIDAEGTVSLLKKRKRDKDKQEKKKDKGHKKSKKKDKDSSPNNEGSDDDEHDDSKMPKSSGDVEDNQEHFTEDKKTTTSQGGPCKGNPLGTTRLFLGNLPFAVDEISLGEFLPNTVTHIKWITDKDTGKFYGSAFVEIETTKAAAEAVAMAGSELMGRPIKINFAPARPGDMWPPTKKVVSGNADDKKRSQAGGTGTKAMSEKPENCVKLFIGNLSYDIDDDAITKFFDGVGAEVKAVRWLSHKDTGDFKGCGFVEFWNTEPCDKAATLNGKVLLGRPIRIDWTD